MKIPMANVDALTDELWHKIICNLQAPEDLKQLSWVSKRFSQLAKCAMQSICKRKETDLLELENQILQRRLQLRDTKYLPLFNDHETNLLEIAGSLNNAIEMPTYSYEIKEIMIANGAPVELIGYLLKIVTSARLKFLIVTEVIAQAFKDELYRQFNRENCNFLTTTVFYLNLFLRRNNESEFSQHQLNELILSYSPPCITHIELNYYFKKLNTTSAIFFQFLRSLMVASGLDITTNCKTRLLETCDQLPARSFSSSQLPTDLSFSSLSFSTVSTSNTQDQILTGQVLPTDILESSLNSIIKKIRGDRRVDNHSEIGDTKMEDEWEVVDGNSISEPKGIEEAEFKLKWFTKRVSIGATKLKETIIAKLDEDKKVNGKSPSRTSSQTL